MRRRYFLRLAGGAAIAWPIGALAHAAGKLPLVAVLLPSSEESASSRMAGLREGLHGEGLVEGSHYVIAVRFANGDLSRLPELAKELDTLQPTVFVAAATAAAVVHKMLPNRPLVFTAMAVDPVEYGFAESYRRPGGTATGNVMNAVGGEEGLTGARLGLFKDLVPKIDRLGMIGVVWNPEILAGVVSHQEETALGKLSVQLGFRFMNYAIKTSEEIGQAFSRALADDVTALYISGDPLLTINMPHVMPHVVAAGKPTLGTYPEWARAGVLMTYSNDLVDSYRRAGTYAAKIVRGANPGNLPIDQASKFTLALNLKTAKQLDIRVPATLLSLADEVIE